MSVNKQKRWTYKGIKRYFPEMAWEEWLKICSQGRHLSKSLNLDLSKAKFT